MKLITIGAESFPTLGKALNRCRDLLNKYDGEDIPSGPDRDFIMALLHRHPGSSDKIGTGVVGFRVVLGGGDVGLAPTRHFEVIRTDGTCADFSYKICLHGQTTRSQVLAAMRTAVAEQSAVVRAGAHSTELKMHVHHDGIAFRQLAEQWLSTENLTFETVAVACPAHGLGKIMKDPRQMSSWQAFHQARAVLVPMDASTHLHLPKGPRNTAASRAA